MLGRGTTENAILAQEAIQLISKSITKKGYIDLKIDLEKAYDRVNWNFLRITLIDFGFPSSIVKLIMWGV